MLHFSFSFLSLSAAVIQTKSCSAWDTPLAEQKSWWEIKILIPLLVQIHQAQTRSLLSFQKMFALTSMTKKKCQNNCWCRWPYLRLYISNHCARKWKQELNRFGICLVYAILLKLSDSCMHCMQSKGTMCQ